MLTLLFVILVFGIFAKMAGFAFRTTWGLARILVKLVLLPIFLVGLVFAGFLHIALPILVIAGIVMLIKKAVS